MYIIWKICFRRKFSCYDLVKLSISHFQSGYQVAQERRNKAVEEIWIAIIEINNFMNPMINFYSILYPSEYYLAFGPKAPFFKLDILHISNLEKISKIVDSTQKYRPYAGEALWGSYMGYWGFLSRMHLFFSEGINERNIPIWFNDKRNADLAKAILKDTALPSLDTPFSLKIILDNMQKKLIDEMNSIISGASASEANIAQGRRIMQLVNEETSQYKALHD